MDYCYTAKIKKLQGIYNFSTERYAAISVQLQIPLVLCILKSTQKMV